MKKSICSMTIIQVIFILLVTFPVLSDELWSRQDYPTVGQTVQIELRLKDTSALETAKLFVEYRPNSETACTLEATDRVRPGVWNFSPRSAGIVQLKAIRETQGPDGPTTETLAAKSISVRFDGLPVSGVLVMIIACIILFGGMAVSVRHALKIRKSS